MEKIADMDVVIKKLLDWKNLEEKPRNHDLHRKHIDIQKTGQKDLKEKLASRWVALHIRFSKKLTLE